MVAFVGSFVVGLILLSIPVGYSLRRKSDQPTTWGEAMGGALYVMFGFFWAMVIVPQSWLTLSQDIWKWSSDRILLGPHNGFIHLPLTITRANVSDIILTMIYGFFLVNMFVVFIIWQTRGKREKSQSNVRRSSFGRPVAKRS